MTKLVYLIPYFILKFFIFFLSKRKISTDLRNSILFDYFEIFKSDLDISITTNANYPQKISILAEKIFKILPYVKEVNHYYEENLKFSVLLNYCEAIRSHAPIKEISGEMKKIECYIFLLRMLQSNLRHLEKSSLSNHTALKWNFYFNLANAPISELMETNDIITNIKNLYPEYSQPLLNVMENLNDTKLTTREKFHKLVYKRESLILFPHIFTSIKFDLKFLNNNEENIYITQLSWEIFGISTQIIHIANDLEAIKHLKNIEFQLKEIEFKSEFAKSRSLQILSLIEKLNRYLLLE